MIPYEMLMDAQKQVVQAWGEHGKKVIELCTAHPSLNMVTKEFLTHCTACGGNWGGMFLTGLQRLRPDVYNAIPDDMGVYAWQGIVATLILCGVDTSK